MSLPMLDPETIEQNQHVLRQMRIELREIRGFLLRMQHQAMLQRNAQISAALAREAEQARAAGERNAPDPRRHDLHGQHHGGRGSGFDPNQPRVPAGNPDGGEWTRIAGPISAPQIDEFSSTGRRRRGSRGESYPEPPIELVVRLAMANARYDHALARIRHYESLTRKSETDPEWKSRTSSWMSRDGYESNVLHAESRAAEAEAKEEELRQRYPEIGGHNPPIEPVGPRLRTSVQRQQQLDPTGYIEAFRKIQSWPDMLHRESRAITHGTVAFAEFEGKPLFGVNSDAPTYTGRDVAAARKFRAILSAKYPESMDTEAIGRMPNDSLFHAETTILLRALTVSKRGTLAGQRIEIHLDQEMCSSCRKVLPYLGMELGNPTVTFVNTRTQVNRTLRDGQWMEGRH